jgi:hypothetical protein
MNAENSNINSNPTSQEIRGEKLHRIFRLESLEFNFEDGDSMILRTLTYDQNTRYCKSIEDHNMNRQVLKRRI